VRFGRDSEKGSEEGVQSLTACSTLTRKHAGEKNRRVKPGGEVIKKIGDIVTGGGKVKQRPTRSSLTARSEGPRYAQPVHAVAENEL